MSQDTSEIRPTLYATFRQNGDLCAVVDSLVEYTRLLARIRRGEMGSEPVDVALKDENGAIVKSFTVRVL